MYPGLSSRGDGERRGEVESGFHLVDFEVVCVCLLSNDVDKLCWDKDIDVVVVDGWMVHDDEMTPSGDPIPR